LLFLLILYLVNFHGYPGFAGIPALITGPPGGMTTRAVLDIRNTFFAVLISDFGGIVAIIACVCCQNLRMASATSIIPTMIHREGMLAVELRR
jgi:hypothetical protein